MQNPKLRVIREIRLARPVNPVQDEGESEEEPQEVDMVPAMCCVRTNCYGSQFSFLRKLVEEARGDFPELGEEDIKIVQFGGERFSGTFGLQFQPPEGAPVPDSYQEIRELEWLL